MNASGPVTFLTGRRNTLQRLEENWSPCIFLDMISLALPVVPST